MSRYGEVIVDMATTGQDLFKHIPVEIAWMREGDQQPSVFIPPHTSAEMDCADPGALEAIEYYGRDLDQPTAWDNDGAELGRLHSALTGKRFVSWNCSADAVMLYQLFQRHALSGSPWFRPVDLAAYAAPYRAIPERRPERVGTLAVARCRRA